MKQSQPSLLYNTKFLYFFFILTTPVFRYVWAMLSHLLIQTITSLLLLQTGFLLSLRYLFRSLDG